MVSAPNPQTGNAGTEPGDCGRWATVAGVAIKWLRFTGLAAAVVATAITSTALAAPNQYLCIIDQSSGLRYDKQADTWKPQAFNAGGKYVLRHLNDDDWKKYRSGLLGFQKPQPTWGFFEFGGDDFPRALCHEDFTFSCNPVVVGLDFDRNSLRFQVTYGGGYISQGYWEQVQRTDPDKYQTQRQKGPDPVSQPDDVGVEIGKCSPF